jgi:hypothetical protein
MAIARDWTYEEVYDAFQWRVPARDNIAFNVCDRHAADRKQLPHRQGRLQLSRALERVQAGRCALLAGRKACVVLRRGGNSVSYRDMTNLARRYLAGRGTKATRSRLTACEIRAKAAQRGFEQKS